MKIFIVCSKYFYDQVIPIKNQLEEIGHEIMLPNSFEAPFKEEEMKSLSKEAHKEWKRKMIRLHEPKIKQNDAILVLNFEKKGMANYIGGATFMEIVKAFELGKQIFMYNPIPDNIFKDELTAIDPVIIDGNLTKLNTTL